MEYIAFALKYRPQDFDEVVGQAHVVTSLKKAIIEKRVHHAYLFSGPRGVGKTSLARILAKSLNCASGPTAKACGTCPSCLSVVKGNSLDIIEIDGASNRGIDEIRTLRENVKLSTAGSRYKIYIIDEVHMLTQEAFNALLKTLEEPPAHVKFIFATTHPHKVPPTILSRCQKFQFNLFTLDEIVSKLKAIVKAEKLKIQENLLYTVARTAEGSIRDAESLLDQLVPVLLEKGSLDEVLSFLGVVGEDSLNTLLKNLVGNDLPACLNFVNDLAESGKDLGVFANAFIGHLRNLLLAKVSDKLFTHLSEVAPATKDEILKLSAAISTTRVLEIIDLLLEVKDISNRLNSVRVPLELALVKFLYRQEEETEAPLVNNKKPEVTAKPLKEKKTEPPAPKNPHLEIDDDDFDFICEQPAPAVQAQTQAPNPDIADNTLDDEPGLNDDLLLGPIKAKWKEALTHMQKTRAALASHLSFAQPVSSAGNLITVAFAHGDYFHKEIVENAKNISFITGIISKAIGKAVGIKFVLRDLAQEPIQAPGAGDEQKPKPSQDPGEAVSGDDEFLNELLDTFGGKFQTDTE